MQMAHYPRPIALVMQKNRSLGDIYDYLREREFRDKWIINPKALSYTGGGPSRILLANLLARWVLFRNSDGCILNHTQQRLLGCFKC